MGWMCGRRSPGRPTSATIWPGSGFPATAGFGVDYRGLHGRDDRIDLASIPKVQAVYHHALLALLRAATPRGPRAAGPAALPARPHLAGRSGRCQAAGIPERTGLATKPALATAMMLAALNAGVRACWMAGDEVYGQDPYLRAVLEARQMGYVLAIAGNRRVDLEGVQLSADQVAARVADRHWHRYRAGEGAKGPRWYAWAWTSIDEGQTQGYRWLLIRRNLTTGELAFYRCYAPTPNP